MDITALIIGLCVGGCLGALLMAVLRPANTTDTTFLKEQLSKLQRENAKLLTEKSASDERVKMLSDMRENMLREFKNLSAEVLEQTRKSATEQQTQQLNVTITPFKTQIEKLTEEFNKQIKDMLKNSTENRANLESQLKIMMESSSALKKEASDLTDALRGKKKLQGNWGEIQVERLFEIMGWQEGVQYDSQKHLSGGRDIPDYIVHMPGDKHFVIDAKMSLNSYMDYTAAEDNATKQHLWRTFVDATKKHIQELSDKHYNKVVDKKFEYVCMFMPLEHAYIELMNRDRDDIYRYAYDRNVMIATPSLVLPMLRTIDTLMKIERQNQNVSKIVEYAEKLYEKYAGFTDEYKRVGDALDKARIAYDGGLKKLSDGRGSISGWFEKIKKQGGLSVTKNLAIAPQQIEEDDDDE